jgi:uncharacterized tellurite resistance protein B-like protein
MSSNEKEISLIRALVALAWADGEINHDEINFLKDFMFKFDWTGEEWAKVEMYIEDPVPLAEAEALVQDFVQRLGGARERQTVIDALQGMMAADGVTTAEERAFVERFIQVIKEGGPAPALVGRIRGLFQQTVFKPAHASKRSEELHEFLNNRILFKVRRKLEREKLAIELNPEALAYASLFGGLLAYVASLNQPISDTQMNLLKKHLKETAGFDGEGVALIESVIREAKDLDRSRLAREFYEKSRPEQRLQLIDCLFDIAGADNDLTYSEVEEVRAIASGLKLSHSEFIDAKTKYLRGSQNRS